MKGYGWKLLRRRKDGSLGPLFINRRQRLFVGQTYEAEDHPTKGYQHRPGWHILNSPYAPHLSKVGRVWARVRYTGGVVHERPAAQGGLWILARTMEIIEIVSYHQIPSEIERCTSIASTVTLLPASPWLGLVISPRLRKLPTPSDMSLTSTSICSTSPPTRKPSSTT